MDSFKRLIFSLTVVMVLMYSCFAQSGGELKTLTVTASFYCHGNNKECKVKSKGITATGDRVRKGIIAVDPRVIPLRRQVEIIKPESLAGMYLSSDTGGKIKKNRIDIWVPTQKEAMKLGMIKNVVLRVYPKGYVKPVEKEKIDVCKGQG